MGKSRGTVDFCFFVNSVSGFIPPFPPSYYFTIDQVLKNVPAPSPQTLNPTSTQIGGKNPVHSRSYRTPYWDTSRIEGLHFFVTWVRSLLITLYICTVSPHGRDHTVSFSVLCLRLLQLMVCCVLLSEVSVVHSI